MMICILFSERASCWGAEKHCSGATGVSFTHNKWSLILLNIKVVPNSPSHFSPKSLSHFFPNSPSHFFLTRSGSLFSFSISFSLFLPKTPREIMVQALQALWCSCFIIFLCFSFFFSFSSVFYISLCFFCIHSVVLQCWVYYVYAVIFSVYSASCTFSLL